MENSKGACSKEKRALRSEFRALELDALAGLCSHWAQKLRDSEGQPFTRSKDRLHCFRWAVLLGKGKREKPWEREFVQDEFDVMLRYARCLRKSTEISDSSWVAAFGKRTIESVRPLPISSADWEALSEYIGKGTTTDRSLAVRLVSLRLGLELAPKKVNARIRGDKKEERRRVKKTPFLQKFAASIFLDLSLCPPHDADRKRGRLLDALALSGYHPIMAYYLVQKAQELTDLPESGGFDLISDENFDKLCSALAGE